MAAPDALPPGVRAPMPARRKMLLQVAGACVTVLAVMFAAVAIARHPKPVTSPLPARFKISLTASPAGAEIKVNGKQCGLSACEVELGAGSYLAEAQLAGFQPASATFTAGTGTSALSPIVLTLQPLMPRLAISTDLADGSIQVDGVDAGQIQGGAVEIASLAAGTHEISLKSASSAASFTLEIAPGQMPSLTGQIHATNLRGFVIVTAGSQAQLYSSMPGFRVTLDGKLIGNLAARSLEFKDLAAGSHELILDGPTGQHDAMVFQSQPIGAVYASLLAGANMGVLMVIAGEDQADVFINGVKYQSGTKQGRLLIYLPPKKYTIRVQKDGFAPVEQQVELHAFRQTKAEFKLVAAKAVLLIHHAPAGSEVLIDGNRAGAARADGEFFTTNLQPGKHSVEVRHEQFKPLQADLTFAPGKTVEMEGLLEGMMGTLRIDVNPPDAHVRIRREGEARDREFAGGSANVPEGNYTVTGSAPHFQDGATTVRVAANRAVTATLALQPEIGRAHV